MPMRVILGGILIAASTAIGMTDVYAQGIEYRKNDYVKFCARVTERQAKETGNLPSLSKERR